MQNTNDSTSSRKGAKGRREKLESLCAFYVFVSLRQRLNVSPRSPV